MVEEAKAGALTRWPVELRLAKDKRTLTVTYEDDVHILPAEYLRVSSPSAEVRGHGPGQAKTVAGKQDVCILSIEMVGNYAVRLVFDDMHSSGIYTWSYLDELGREQNERWDAYLKELESKGLTRAPAIRR